MTTHTARFTSPVVVGSVVTGISEGRTKNGRLTYSTEWSGIYDGIKPSEWTGQPDHWFHDGIIGVTPQSVFAIPVSRFPVKVKAMNNETDRFRSAFRNLSDRRDEDVERLRQEYAADMIAALPHHYTFFQPDGTCFSVAAVDVWAAKEKELSYLGVPVTVGNASFCQSSEDVQTPAQIKAALRKSHRMYGKRS